MRSGAEPKAVGEGESLVSSVKRLEGLLDNVHAYVNDVVVGGYLYGLLSTVVACVR